MRRHAFAPTLARVSGAAALALLLSAPLGAQDNTRNPACLRHYNAAVHDTLKIDTTDPDVVALGCRQVANAITDVWENKQMFGSRVSPRDVAATRDQTTAAPGEASAPIEPVEAAGGSVAAVGTDKRAGAVAAIAINPSVFFVDPSNTAEVARWSRFTDVTLLVPASDLSGEDDDHDVDYVGVRWGISLTGLERGSQLHQEMVNAYAAFLKGSSVQTLRLISLLETVPEGNLEPCIRLLTATAALDEEAVNRITQTCGGTPVAIDPAVFTALQAAIRAARIKADSKYFGVDLRADFGDLALAGVDSVRGTALFAGVGWGRRFVRGTEMTTGIRLHAGARYWDLEDEDKTHVAVEGGLAFEAVRFYNFQRLTLVGGLDFQHRTDNLLPDEEATSINIKGSLNVPVTSTSSVTVNLAAPVAGERRGPVLSIKGNWRLLWDRMF